MDQGIAGVIAGIAGLVGAGVGGLATAYGARVGAQKTIEATHMQVARQSEAEHLHWIRDHRRQACSDVLASHGSFLSMAINGSVRLGSDHALSDEEQLRLRDQFIDLSQVAARADLWGPRDVVVQAQALRSAAGTMFAALVGWSAAIVEGRTGDISSLSEEYETASQALKTARSSFVEAAIQALQF
ncbi:hypothetical protein [Streptomyces sp. NPDC093984]|uniref:hypothetical protein n=1 Tax=Streptomyces sp. NPDC093984 TaxID=3366052 RepID=UPI0038093D64